MQGSTATARRAVGRATSTSPRQLIVYAPAGEPWLWAKHGLDDVAADMIADEDGDLAHAFLVRSWSTTGPRAARTRRRGATDAAQDCCAPGGGQGPAAPVSADVAALFDVAVAAVRRRRQRPRLCQ